MLSNLDVRVLRVETLERLLRQVLLLSGLLNLTFDLLSPLLE